MMDWPRPLIGLALAAALSGGDAVSSGRPPAIVTVEVAVERPVPIAGPAQVVPWSLVRDLTAQDFEILSDGTACAIESFARSVSPLSIVVLADVSASTEVPVHWLLESVQSGLVPSLAPGDRVAFGRFGGAPLHVKRDFSGSAADIGEAARAVLTSPPDAAAPSWPAAVPGPVRLDPVLLVPGMNGAFGLGASPAWDAVDAAVTALASQPGPRAVMLITDGRSTGNALGVEDAILRAVTENVCVLVVGLAEDELIRQDGTATARVQPALLLRSMAATTGGAYAAVFGPGKSRPERVDGLAARPARLREGGEPLKPARIDERAFKQWVARTLAAFVNDLHGSYSIGFRVPALDGRLHTLDVRVRTPGLKARARQRYAARP